MNKCKVLRFDLHLEGLGFDLRVFVFHLEFRSSGSTVQFRCLFFSSGIFDHFFIVKREGFDLQC